MISFFMPMDDIPTATLQQKRAAMVNGRLMMYEPKNVKDTIKFFTHHLKPHRPKEKLNGPIECHIRWCFPIKQKKKWNTWKETRPDLDNMAKILIDRMTDLDFFNDDSQIVSLHVEKIYVEPGKGGIQIELINQIGFYWL